MAIDNNLMIVYEVKLRGQIGSGGGRAIPTTTSFFYRRTTVSPVPSKSALAAAFEAAVTAKVALLVNARWTALGLDVRCVNDADDPFVTFPSVAVGAIAGDGLSSISNTYFLLRTGLRKTVRFGGRHIGPLSESQVTTPNEDILNAAALVVAGNLGTAIGQSLVDAVPLTWVPVILRRKKPAQYRTNPTNAVYADVTQVLVNKRIAKLKRRQILSTY
jgi:hypothetical protein